jgi:hypothetical protein
MLWDEKIHPAKGFSKIAVQRVYQRVRGKGGKGDKGTAGIV